MPIVGFVIRVSKSEVVKVSGQPATGKLAGKTSTSYSSDDYVRD
ncbi:hypothetical protein [Fulvivirga sp.]